MQDMGIWNALPSPKRPHGACAGGQVPDFSRSTTTQHPPSRALPPSGPQGRTDPPPRVPADQEGKEQPWS